MLQTDRPDQSLAQQTAQSREPVTLESAERVLVMLEGALRGLEPVAKAVAGEAPAARSAAAQAFYQHFRAAAEARKAGRLALAAAQAAQGPVSRIQALGDVGVPQLQAAARALFTAARGLKGDPRLGPLLPAALGAGPPQAGLGRSPSLPGSVARPAAQAAPASPGQAAPSAVPDATPQAPAPAASASTAQAAAPVAKPDSAPISTPKPFLARLASAWDAAAARASDTLAATEAALTMPVSEAPLGPLRLETLTEILAAVEPVYSYTAARTPFLEAGLALHDHGQAPPAYPPSKAAVGRALGHLFLHEPPALLVSRQALVQLAELQRAMLAARMQRDNTQASPARLRGLAIPLTGLPRRLAPFPVLCDIFPLLTSDPPGDPALAVG